MKRSAIFARPAGRATVYSAIGDDVTEFVVSVPCKIDGRFETDVVKFSLPTAERAEAFAAAVNVTRAAG